MEFITSDMRLLAQEVLKEEPDPVVARALADCVCESVNNPDFRFTVDYVSRCEEALRECRVLLNTYKSGKVNLRDYGIRSDRVLESIFNLQRQARQDFKREGV